MDGKLALLLGLMMVLAACTPGLAPVDDNMAAENTAAEKTDVAGNTADEDAAPLKAKLAPAFAVTTIAGESVSLESLLAEEKPFVIYFTASWCPVCAKNWPALVEVYPEYVDRLNIVMISIDPTDSAEVMQGLVDKHGFQFHVVSGNPSIMTDFGVKSQATTVGVNSDGTVLFVKEKSALSADEYRALFDQLQ